jgi:hypothetical protein
MTDLDASVPGRPELREVCLGVSADSAGTLAPVLAARLQQLAAELAEHLPELVAVIEKRAVEAVPEFVAAGDPTSMEAVTHSTSANVGAILTMLAHGVPATSTEPPVGALELFDRIAERDDGLELILRGYRVGMSELWQLWARWVADHVSDHDDLYALLAASTSFIMTFIARVSGELVARWEQTHRRRERGLGLSPEEIIRKALYDISTPASMLDPLGYDADRTHLAFALPAELTDDQIAELRARIHGLASAHMLTLRRDTGIIVWVGLGRVPGPSLRESLESAIGDGRAVGASEPRSGLAGFRTACHEALDARRIAVLRAETTLTHYRDVALLSVLTADPERARALAIAELGELADESPSMARLRETLRTYLACGESQVVTAGRLGVHEKTVGYRIRKAEKLLGVSIRDRHTEVEASLLIHASLPDTANS